MKKGKAYLVGAGPGDPELITVKGLECIRRAQVVIYDYLASPALLKHASSDAEIIYVGKKGGNHTMSQDDINALIADKAGQGLIVTRLKGGDPFIFGRGGEEAEVLIDQGIDYEIVPGVTSAIAAPAYAGIPLTHRNFTSTVAFVTGHEDPTKKQSTIDWQSLAKGIGTLVFLMGVKNLPNITRRLLENGMDPKTPAAVVRWGTTPRQEAVTGTLQTIEEEVKTAGIQAPAIILVGQVVTLREKMNWFETRPLLGKKIVVTRAREQAGVLVKQLSQLGADCLECPTIKIVPPDDWAPLDEAIEHLEDYHWLVFTSVNGVKCFFERLFATGRDVRVLGHLQTACIGPATSAGLLDFGIKADIVPKSYRAESVVEAFRGIDIQNQRILLPRAKEARPVLPVELKKMGACVDEITTYQTRQVCDHAASLSTELKEGLIDMVTFTSSSTVRNFHALLPADSYNQLMKNVAVACIGPITADTAREYGFTVDIIAESYTIPGLCEAVQTYYAK